MKDNNKIIELICVCVALAMGVSVVVLNILGELNVKDGLSLVGIGIISLSINKSIKIRH